MLLLKDIKLSAFADERELLALCERKLRAPCRYFRILKKSLDARDKGDIKWVYTVECSEKTVPHPPKMYEKVKKMPRVFVVGAGPAGLFCALRLLDHGIRPVLLERGKRVEERAEDVRRFRETGVLDPSSNVQFGEGGAGTFSDGKLNTQTGSPLHADVLGTFVRFGAPPETEYLNKPHIGSDRLRGIVAAMREYILSAGGEVRFGALLTDLERRGGKAVITVNGVREEADDIVLAIGHSARDTFAMLRARGFQMEQKEFAAGLRIEHPQAEIGRAQYGPRYAELPAADYKLVSHAGERAAFTFCMCPGGVVVPAASEEGGVVVNGMSDYARDGKNANSAVVVQVKKEDFHSDDPLAGVAFQREMERRAYAAAGGYRAPVQLVGDFLVGRESRAFGGVEPTYALGTSFAPAESYLPAVLVQTLRAAIPDMGRRLRGFDRPDAVLTGVESRTSSPVRILRGEDGQAIGAEGVYPCGEGCGYAGGISSAAADGLRTAELLSRKYL